ncbi:methyltransferase, FkbM family [Arboricoccus pini]|uniref:Methyltransferase, FkbM family n=1 Tax=Arboricoccus pini TaxID=1963835 RepID=A0A212RDK5_9PROT|nr:FkbM family methyltransferase [Arboricoccus pini]SNB70243.1 methyltransferase, FkbM family [Arboricoccus pini]
MTMWKNWRQRRKTSPLEVPLRPGLDPRALESQTPIGISTEARIAMAVRCRDADDVPKVKNAGKVVELADGGPVQIMHNGLRVKAGGYHGLWMQHLIELCRGHHEPQEERAFHAVMGILPEKGWMIELGGFWSYYSLWFLQGHRKRRAIVLEPDPAHIEVGRANARLNDLAPDFVQGFVGATSLAPQAFETEDSGICQVPRYSVPDLLASRRIERLTLLHCDTQGAEFDTLLGCEALFAARRIDWVFVSTHVHHISGDPLTHQRCLALLLNAGATIVAEHDVHESFSGDGLIVATFAPLPRTWRPLQLSHNRYSTSLFRNPLYDLAARGASG